MLASAGPNVNHPIGDFDGVLVMLNNNDGIAQFAQANQGFDQPVIVSLVEANRGFIEHVQHANQPGTNL